MIYGNNILSSGEIEDPCVKWHYLTLHRDKQ